MKDQLKSSLLGLAVADALGVPVEFQSRELLKRDPVMDMREYGTYKQPRGTWSDDTTMTICLLESLNRGLDYADIMDNFLMWYKEGHFTAHNNLFDIGITTSRSLDRYISGMNPLECGGVHEEDNGNGSLMRILPILFYIYDKYNTFLYTDECFELVHNISNLTHRHKRSHIACGIYISIAHHIIQKEHLNMAITNGINDAYDYYKSKEGYDQELKYYNRLFDISFKDLDESSISSSGYVVDTLEASIWCLLNTKNYKEAVLRAVNLGEDTDTVGAITGGLAGLYYGGKEIPKEWLNDLVKKDYLESLCE